MADYPDPLVVPPTVPSYPPVFREPDYQPYSILGRSGVQRTPFDAGNMRQRRAYTHMPQEAALRFAMTYEDLGEWQLWWNAYAYTWFYIRIASMYSGLNGTQCLPHLVRCTTDLQIVAQSVPGWVEVRCDIEFHNVQPYAGVIPGPNNWGDWIVATNPPASDDWYVAGRPSSPSNKNLTKPGRPPRPSALVI